MVSVDTLAHTRLCDPLPRGMVKEWWMTSCMVLASRTALGTRDLCFAAQSRSAPSLFQQKGRVEVLGGGGWRGDKASGHISSRLGVGCGCSASSTTDGVQHVEGHGLDPS